MKCNHNIDNIDTTIILNKNKWLGVFPRMYIGICSNCNKVFKYNKKGNKFLKVGE